MMIRLASYLQAVRRRDWVVTLEGKSGMSFLGLCTGVPGVRFDEKINISDKLKHSIHIEWPLDILENTFKFLAMRTKKQGMVVRMDKKQGVSYLTAGQFWLCVTSKKED